MMTAAFAVGQIAGPLSVSLFAGSSNAFTVTSIMAASALVVGNFVLSVDRTDTEGIYDLPSDTYKRKSPGSREETQC